MKDLQRRRIAVTGASGFIGGRLVEYLAGRTEATTTVMVRRLCRLGRIAELPQSRLRFVRADVLERDSLRAALDGCDTVVHCAFGSDGDDDLRWRTTVDGTELVVGAAREAGIRRFVNVSTAAIHDTRGLAVLEEGAPRIDALPPSYEAAKQRTEDIVAASGLDAISLRPTVVYGPWGQDWTRNVIARLQAAEVRLPRGVHDGVCNAVYVDDVVRAIVHACLVDANEPVLVCGPEPVSWGRFYDAFRELFRAPPVDGPADVEAWERDLYADRATASPATAERVLGWRPVVGFERGMARVASWATWAGLAT